MTLQVKAGQFAKRTSTGSQAITGVGFTPKLIIFQGTDGETNGTTETDFARLFYGATSGPSNSLCYAISARPAASGGSAGTVNTRYRTSAVVINDTTGVIDEAALTSFDTDGFTLNWTTASSQAQLINYLAIGGSEVSALVTTVTKPTTSSNVSYTGFGFKPDALLLVTPAFTGTNASSSSATIAVGGVDSALNQWSMQTENKSASTSSVTAQIRNSEAQGLVDNFDSNWKYRATVASMDTDGFTIHPVTSEATGSSVMVIALKGVKARTGIMTKNSTNSNNNQSVTGLGFRPKALLLFDHQIASDNGLPTGGPINYGITDGIGNYGAHSYVRDNQTAPPARSRTDNTRMLHATTLAADGALYDGSLSSFDGGGFTMAWTTSATYGSRIGYMALGDQQPIVEQVSCAIAG